MIEYIAENIAINNWISIHNETYDTYEEALREDMIQWIKEDYNPGDALDDRLEYLANRFDR